jgi:hypothetical protein
MGERSTANHQIVVFVHEGSVLCAVVDAVHLEGVADPGGAGAQYAVEIALERIRAVQVDAFVAVASQAKAGKKAWKAEHVIAVHMGHEDPSELREPKFAPQKLMLGSLATVEQPHLRSLWQTQRYSRYVAGPGGNA